MCEGGVSPVVSAHMYKVAMQPILTYGCSTLNVFPCIIDQLDKYQAKLIKFSLGLPKCCRNIPLLKALNPIWSGLFDAPYGPGGEGAHMPPL